MHVAASANSCSTWAWGEGGVSGVGSRTERGKYTSGSWYHALHGIPLSEDRTQHGLDFDASDVPLKSLGPWRDARVGRSQHGVQVHSHLLSLGAEEALPITTVQCLDFGRCRSQRCSLTALPPSLVWRDSREVCLQLGDFGSEFILVCEVAEH